MGLIDLRLIPIPDVIERSDETGWLIFEAEEKRTEPWPQTMPMELCE